eukprot:NODE_5299_length_1786_cov_5.361664.p2 GENE.NODE_5299_length_1786_cov_5.361664~~NODE_5299_length_1786_cov_5.361664.p2  ORF type:complete len:202 (-),score=72.12 NODE_5299_length_1786_cov_5.361664:745-1350(-)
MHPSSSLQCGCRGHDCGRVHIAGEHSVQCIGGPPPALGFALAALAFLFPLASCCCRVSRVKAAVLHELEAWRERGIYVGYHGSTRWHQARLVVHVPLQSAEQPQLQPPAQPQPQPQQHSSPRTVALPLLQNTSMELATLPPPQQQQPEPQLQPAPRTVQVAVPGGCAAGAVLAFTTPEGRAMRISVPEAVPPGGSVIAGYE